MEKGENGRRPTRLPNEWVGFHKDRRKKIQIASPKRREPKKGTGPLGQSAIEKEREKNLNALRPSTAGSLAVSRPRHVSPEGLRLLAPGGGGKKEKRATAPGMNTLRTE